MLNFGQQTGGDAELLLLQAKLNLAATEKGGTKEPAEALNRWLAGYAPVLAEHKQLALVEAFQDLFNALWSMDWEEEERERVLLEAMGPLMKGFSFPDGKELLEIRRLFLFWRKDYLENRRAAETLFTLAGEAAEKNPVLGRILRREVLNLLLNTEAFPHCLALIHRLVDQLESDGEGVRQAALDCRSRLFFYRGEPV